MQWDNDGRDWSDASINQEMPRTIGNYQKLGDRYGLDSSSEVPRGINPTYTLILGFRPPEK